MLGEGKRSIINVNLKKYARQIQHHITDLKMELLVKVVNDCKLLTTFTKKHHFRCDAGSEFASDYNKSMFLVNNKGTLSQFLWNGGCYYLAEILPREFKVNYRNTKTLEHNVKCV